jgi:predicted acyl esterase
MVGEHGISWPWESLHYEALAWFDHWLKGPDTGILEGPRFRYVIPQAEGWQTTEQWPLPEARHRAFALRADGGLDTEEGDGGSRKYMNLGGGLNRPRAGDDDPPSFLTWETAALDHDLDIVGPIELQLDASCTAPDTAFIAVLQDIDSSGRDAEVTAGYLRAGLRSVDESESQPGIPVLPCRNFVPVPIGERVRYRIPLVPNARRFKAGHKIRLFVTTDDQSEDKPCVIGFRHASIGTSSLNTCFSTSRLLLPILEQ